MTSNPASNRTRHRRAACQANCPLDPSGKCAEHRIVRWTLGVLVVVGVTVVGFSWRTNATVTEGLHNLQTAVQVQTYAQQQNYALIQQLANKESPTPLFRKQVEKIEGRVEYLERKHSNGKPQ